MRPTFLPDDQDTTKRLPLASRSAIYGERNDDPGALRAGRGAVGQAVNKKGG